MAYSPRARAATPRPAFFGLAAAIIAVALLSSSPNVLAQKPPATASAKGPAAPAIFLPTLPLTPVAATPTGLLSSSSSNNGNDGFLTLDGDQTSLTAVFSRPVIALGSDFGLDADKPLPLNITPFIVDCPVPGRTRWVTTNIARWDASVPWPPDLDCAIKWNVANLRSFDGAPLTLPAGAPASVRVRTPGLTTTLETVRSASADALTGDYWNTFAGMKQGNGDPFQPADKTPEVPPDGNVTLSFSYPVAFSALKAGVIKVEGCCGTDVPGGGKEYKAEWLPCGKPSTPAPYHSAGGSGGGGGSSSLSSSSSSSSSPANATCAILRISPPIPFNGTALIRLPRGAVYNPSAGAARNETLIYVHGLRPFRVPLRQDFAQLNATQRVDFGSTNYALVNYRRILMWLPHGLAAGTDATKALLPQVSVCRFADPYDWASPCADLDKKGWALSRPKPGQVVIYVPQLQPRQHYRIRVAASENVRDGYGLPLGFSQAYFFTNELYPAFQGPQMASSPSVVVLEADGGAQAGEEELLAAAAQEAAAAAAASSSGGGGARRGVGGGLQRLFGRRGGAAAGERSTPGSDGARALLLPLSDARVPWTLVARGNTSASPRNFLAWEVEDLSAPNVMRARTLARAPYEVTPDLIGPLVATAGNGSFGTVPSPYAPYFNASRPSGSQSDPAFLPFSLASAREAPAQLIGFCCEEPNSYSQYVPGALTNNKALVLQSRLQAAVVKTDRRLTFWVTDTRASPGAAPSPGPGASSAVPAAPPSPVAKAKVSVFEQDDEYRSRNAARVAVASCETDAEGICSLEFKRTDNSLTAVVEPPSSSKGGDPPSSSDWGAPLIVPGIDTYSSSPSSASDAKKATLRAAVVLDRGLARPGGPDPVHVTAYIQRQDGTALSPPPVSTPLLRAFVVVDPSPDPTQAARGEALRVPADYDPLFGSARASFSIPSGAAAQSYQVFLGVTKTPGYQSSSEAEGGSLYVGGNGAEDLSLLAQASFTASDPRIPTAQLTLLAPDWSPPLQDIVVLLRAESFVGSSVANASVSLEWRVTSPSTQTPASGKIDVTTDALGRARVLIPAGAASLVRGINATSAGDAVDISAVWIGPTRERVDADAQVVVAEGPVKVSLSRSPVTDVPGVPFGVTARAFASNRQASPLDLPPLGDGGGGDNQGGGGVLVDVSLAAADLPPGAVAASGGVAAARRAAADLAVAQGFDAKTSLALAADPLANCSSAERQSLKAQKCRVVSGAGDFSACTLVLPCPGDFVLRACAVSFANGTKVPGAPCYESPVGRNASSWASAPWQHQPLLRAEPQRQRFSSGDTPAISFVNSYYGVPASALIVYGNQVATKTKYVAYVPPGPASVSLDPIGKECEGGCHVSLTLAVPRPPPGAASKAAAVPSRVPRSVVFDPLSPHVQSTDLTLVVPYPNLANVSVAIDGQGIDYDPPQEEADAALLATGGLDPSSPQAAALALLPPFNTSLAPGGRVNAPLPDEPAPEVDPAAPIPVVLPKSKNAVVRVRVVDGATGKPSSGAEVTVIAVDKAVLALVPVDLRLLGASDLRPALLGDVRSFSVNENRANAAAVDAVFAALRRRMLIDPFLPVDTTITPSYAVYYGGWPAALSYPLPGAADQPDAVYLAKYRTAVSVTPFYDWSELARYGAGASGKGGSASAALRFSKNFRMTPLYAVVKTDADGYAAVPFVAPENAGTFVVRAYAATNAPALAAGARRGARQQQGPLRGPTKYGAAGTEVVVRLPVTLTASVPRLVRVGDGFEAGVVVSAPFVKTKRSGGEAVVEVTARVVGQAPAANTTSGETTTTTVLQLLGGGEDDNSGGGATATKTVRLTRLDEQEEVRFRWSAEAVGKATVVFSARVVGPKEEDLGDALEQELEVLGRQAPVFVATSFALSGAENGGENGGGENDAAVISRTEGLSLPAADLGAGGSLDLVAGVGALPALESSYGQLLRQGALLRGDDEEDAAPTAGGGGKNATAAKAAAGAPAAPAAEEEDSGEVLNAYLSVATASMPGFIARYKQGAWSWLPAASANASARAARDAAMPLTVKEAGLVYSPPSSSSSSGNYQPPPRPDVELNSWGVWVVEQASAANGSSSSSINDNNAAAPLPPPLAGDFAKLQNASSSAWRPAIASGLVRAAEDARQRSYAYADWSTLSWARLVLGASWTPPSGTDANATSDLSMAALTAAVLAGNATVGASARTALALEAGGGPPAADLAAAAKIRDRLLSSLRVAGRTAYVSNLPGAPGAAPLQAQAFALLLLSVDQPGTASIPPSAQNPLVQKLAAYVAQGGSALSPSGALCVSVSGADAAVAAAALAAYDARAGSADPDLRIAVTAEGVAVSPGAEASAETTADGVAVVSGGGDGGGENNDGSGGKGGSLSLLKAEFSAANAGTVASSSTPWSSLAPPSPSSPPAALVFEAEGRGQASVAAGLSFTPKDLLPFPTYRGIYVERIIQAESGEGPALRAVPLASVVTVSVQLTSADDLQGVVVESWMPGGLEPLDPNVYGDAGAQVTCGQGGGGYDGGGWASSPSPRWYGWWLCPTAQVAPASVRFSYPYLSAGTRTVKFKAVAATAGEFVLPPTKAFVAMQPEVMGLSGAGTLIVCDLGRGPAAAKTAATTGERSCGPGSGAGGVKAPKACPAPAGGQGLACSGNGACDLSKGACVCQAGFSGAACERAAAA